MLVGDGVGAAVGGHAPPAVVAASPAEDDQF